MSNFLKLPILISLSPLFLLIACQPNSQVSPPTETTTSPTVSNTFSPSPDNTSSPSPTLSPINTRPSVGINLGGLTYYGTDYPFINVFKNASQWRTFCVNTDPGCTEKTATKEENLLKLDRNGWVKSLPNPEDSPVYTKVRSLLFSGADSNYISGQYIVSYKGQGKIVYGGGAQLLKSQPGEDLINVDLNQKRGMWLEIVKTDPKNNGNYIRDISIVKSEFKNRPKNQIFSPLFLEKLQDFEVIRFMDWMNTNKSNERTWNQRTLPEHATYMHVTAPVEVMVALSNQLEISPWFNMPHMADDEYISNFAKLVKEQLNPNLKIYVEYSNEIWNFTFPQGNWIQKQAEKEWPAPKYPEKPLAKKLNWHGKRTAEMCEIWKQVFADNPQRIICTLGSQAANPWASIQSLDCPLWVKKPCYKHQIDALAIGPYFGNYIGSLKHEQEVVNWSLDQLFAEINSGTGLDETRPGGALADAKAKMVASFEVAKQRNLKLVAYEGGQHLSGVRRVANNQTIADLFIAANRDPRMFQAYVTLFNDWKSIGGSEFVFFNFVSPSGKWGSWGLLEQMNQESSPKYQAVKDFIKQNP